MLRIRWPISLAIHACARNIETCRGLQLSQSRGSCRPSTTLVNKTWLNNPNNSPTRIKAIELLHVGNLSERLLTAATLANHDHMWPTCPTSPTAMSVSTAWPEFEVVTTTWLPSGTLMWCVWARLLVSTTDGATSAAWIPAFTAACVTGSTIMWPGTCCVTLTAGPWERWGKNLRPQPKKGTSWWQKLCYTMC